MNLIFIFNYKKGAALSSRPNTEILSQHLDCPLLQMQCDQDSPWELASKSGEIWPGILIMKRNIQAVQPHNFHVWSLFFFFFFFLSIECSFPSLKRCGRQPGKKATTHHRVDLNLPKEADRTNGSSKVNPRWKLHVSVL